ncbi:ataxin-2 homolog [Folsomia candida]|uniref:ataxin-2 homolog n=1 Tax=Folsomia candida TaxID=158441 RepID=UPI000B8FCBF0|nr:ataxin-2 homolog [Folsomia candida]
MHNSRISLLLIVTLGTVLVVNGQRGSPISSYFGRGSPSPPTQGLGYPQQSQAYSPYGKKPGKSTGPNLIGWLGSQMAKFPSFTRSARPSNPFPQQKYKQQIHGGGGGGKLPVIFSSSSSKYGGSSVNSIHGGGGDVSHIYMPPGSTTPSASMTPQNTIFQIISADGSSRYQASPPPGYENFFSGQQPGGSSPQQSQFSRSPPTPPQRPSLPVHSMDQVVQQQGQFGQVVYHSAGQQPLYGAKAAGNIELIPSKMVSYEKQVLSTGHPEYQASLDGMVTSASNGYPVYYQQQQQQQQQQQVQQQVQYTHPSLPGNYEYRGQQVQRIDENLGSMLNGVSPDIAPIYDLSSLHGQEQQQQQQVAPSHQEPIYVQPPQQQQYASPDNQDMQADYSHQSAAMSVVQPPSNFQYQGVQQQSQQDLQVAESNNQQQQVQIVNHGAADGNPTFEVFADANAPTYDGGHPFDINQLISMIEPGAQVDPKDIVSEDQENAASNNPAYAASQQQEFLPQYDPTQVQQ